MGFPPLCFVLGMVLISQCSDEEHDLGSGELQRQSLDYSLEILWQEARPVFLAYRLNPNELQSFCLFFPLRADAVAERGTRWRSESLCHLGNPPHQAERPHHPRQPGIHEEVLHSVLHQVRKVSYPHGNESLRASAFTTLCVTICLLGAWAKTRPTQGEHRGRWCRAASTSSCWQG